MILRFRVMLSSESEDSYNVLFPVARLLLGCCYVYSSTYPPKRV